MFSKRFEPTTIGIVMPRSKPWAMTTTSQQKLKYNVLSSFCMRSWCDFAPSCVSEQWLMEISVGNSSKILQWKSTLYWAIETYDQTTNLNDYFLASVPALASVISCTLCRVYNNFCADVLYMIRLCVKTQCMCQAPDRFKTRDEGTWYKQYIKMTI